jgi:hypothetical protein
VCRDRTPRREDLADRVFFPHGAALEDQDPVRDAGDHAEVVRDEQDREPESAPEVG